MEHFDDGAHALEGRVRARGMFYAAQLAAKLPELKPHALPVGDDLFFDSAFDPARYYCDDAIALSLATPTPTVSVSPELVARLEALAAAVVPHAIDAPTTAPTAGDLATEVGISDDTFRRVRGAAKIDSRLKGAAARNRRYTSKEIDKLRAAALAGNFIERRAMADKWAKWGSK